MTCFYKSAEGVCKKYNAEKQRYSFDCEESEIRDLLEQNNIRYINSCAVKRKKLGYYLNIWGRKS